MCDEVFGEKNYLAQVVWERAYSPINLMKHFSPSHDYILCYAKNIDSAICYGIPRTSEANERYSNPDNDPRGDWKSSDLSVGPAVESNIYPITTPSGRVVMPPSGYSWRLSEPKFREYVADNRIWFGNDGNNVPSIKRFLSELRKKGITPMTFWRYEDVGHSQDATQKLARLFDERKVFDYPKPVELIKRSLSLYCDSDSIIVDFFSLVLPQLHMLLCNLMLKMAAIGNIYWFNFLKKQHKTAKPINQALRTSVILVRSVFVVQVRKSKRNILRQKTLT